MFVLLCFFKNFFCGGVKRFCPEISGQTRAVKIVSKTRNSLNFESIHSLIYSIIHSLIRANERMNWLRFFADNSPRIILYE
jgi:hypothetical protein